jgi:putative aldouronate transport system permease protein
VRLLDSGRIRKSFPLYVFLLPGLLYYLVFRYAPMAGLVIAFKNYRITSGIFGSEWVGFYQFKSFFESYYFWPLLRNTLLLGFYSLLAEFFIPLLFALLLNEIRYQPFKRTVQSISYLPYFISTVVIAGLTLSFLSPSTGIVNVALAKVFGVEPIYFMGDPKYFRGIYVIMTTWKNYGWNAIIYLAALAGVDPQLYEAAEIDGANRRHKMLHVTLPALAPTIIIVLILNLGHILDVSFESVFLLYNPLLYDTADVIQTFVYRRGIVGGKTALPNYSFATAVGLFQSVINFAVLVLANRFAKSVSEYSLW